MCMLSTCSTSEPQIDWTLPNLVQLDYLPAPGLDGVPHRLAKFPALSLCFLDFNPSFLRVVLQGEECKEFSQGGVGCAGKKG